MGCYPSLALGASNVTLMELTAAYGMFANGGIYNEPVVITKIVDWKGKVLLERFQDARQATSPEVAYLMTSMMQSVIQHGTARALRVLNVQRQARLARRTITTMPGLSVIHQNW